MPRGPRLDAPGLMQHVMSRGIERREIFKDGDDQKSFLERLGKILSETKTVCLAWVLMSNHFHLLLRTDSISLPKLMQRLLTGYAVAFNRRHGCSGHLFQNRYKSILCEEDSYLLELFRYIHLNPVRAKMVEDIKELDHYPWSGHSVLMGNQLCKWQASEEVLSLFSSRLNEARRRYQLYLSEGFDQGRRPELVGGGLIRSAGGLKELLQEYKESKQKMYYDERILGSSDFVEAILSQTEKEKLEQEKIRQKGLTVEELIRRIAVEIGFREEDLACGRRDRLVSLGRTIISYLAIQRLGVSGKSLREALGVGSSNVSRAYIRGREYLSKRKELEDNLLK